MKRTIKLFALTALLGTFAAAETIVTVNGTKITTEDVQEILMEGTQGQFDSLPPEKQQELSKRIIDGMVTQELIYGDALKSGVLESELYKKELEVVLSRIKKQLAAKVWEKQQFDSIAVTEAERKKYFNEHEAEFVDEENAHARHILVKTENKAQELIGQLRGLSGDALKNKFAELAKAESTGPSSKDGGDLGIFGKGRMLPEFDAAVFSMKIGTISPNPVKTKEGYHVIYLEDRQAGKKLGYDEVKGYIEQLLRTQKFNAHMQKKMQELQKAATISYGNK